MLAILACSFWMWLVLVLRAFELGEGNPWGMCLSMRLWIVLELLMWGFIGNRLFWLLMIDYCLYFFYVWNGLVNNGGLIHPRIINFEFPIKKNGLICLIGSTKPIFNLPFVLWIIFNMIASLRNRGYLTPCHFFIIINFIVFIYSAYDLNWSRGKLPLKRTPLFGGPWFFVFQRFLLFQTSWVFIILIWISAIVGTATFLLFVESVWLINEVWPLLGWGFGEIKACTWIGFVIFIEIIVH